MKLCLGIDVACRAEHVASMADETGRLVWQQRRFHTTEADLVSLGDEIDPGGELTVVLEPTRNAWVPIAAHFLARGHRVVLVPPERSADLRRYYSKHAKTDGLDSRILARLPLLHPEGLVGLSDLGPAQALKRAVRRRARLVADRTACHLRIACLLEMLGPGYLETLGSGDYPKAALAVLARYGDPRALRRLGKARLVALMRRASRGAWGDDKAGQLLDAAGEALRLWRDGGLDLDELAWDLASEVRIGAAIDAELGHLEGRIARLYAEADPGGIFTSAPSVGPALGPGILGRLGDARRFGNLKGVRSFAGLVPTTEQSGTAERRSGITKAGDPGLRRDLYLAADRARRVDPQLAAKYHRLMTERGVHHTSAVCHVATTLLSRLAACWRKGEWYVLRDVDGREITEAEGRAIVAERYQVPEEVRAARRRGRKAQRW
ncbi:MAG: IS110 family transposase, partial [Actinomycetota bacterium]